MWWLDVWLRFVNMNWLPSIWVAGALLALCGGRNPLHEALVNYVESGGSRWNATVTVATDYQRLMSTEDGLLNHTKLIQAMVAGALESEVSIHPLGSRPAPPCSTATALLIGCSFTLPLHDVTSKLHLLLLMAEVSSVTVEDVDECGEPALHRCSLHADCNNTVGSYQCVCRQGYADVDHNNPGVDCTPPVGSWTTTGPPLTHRPLMNAAFITSSSSTQEPPGQGTAALLLSSETGGTTPLSNTGSVTSNPSDASPGARSAASTSRGAAAESTPPTCRPASISSLWLANVTGASITVSWASPAHTNQTFRVALSKKSEVVLIGETRETSMEMGGLQAGGVYSLTVTPSACGEEGGAHRAVVKTDARTLDATARLTNIQFTADLRKTSSWSYQNLSEGLSQEIYQSLPPEMKAMVDSGQMRVELRGFSPGSVVIDFTIILSPVQNREISDAAAAVVQSLMNSSRYTVDASSTRIEDFDECASGEHDCSLWATCTNTWASYTCVCMDGFIDNNPQRPGRSCQASVSLDVTPPAAPTRRPDTDALLQAALSVQCGAASITVTVAKDFLLSADIQDSALYLGLVDCGVNGGNDTHVQLTVAWDECATTLVHNKTHYTASTTLFKSLDPPDSPSGAVAVPRMQLGVPIVCTCRRSLLMSADFDSVGYDMIQDDLGGSVQVTVQRMNAASSLSPKDALVVEVSLNGTAEQMKVVIDKCWATPTHDPADNFSSTFLENSCPLNSFTRMLMNGNSSSSRLSVHIFSFVDLDLIFLHCRVQICVEVGADTCVPDCLQRSARTANTVRSAIGSSGPVLRSGEESLEDKFDVLHIVGLSCLGVGLSLFFIIGFICLLYYQRNRIGHYNFTVKNQKQENFTYIDCHT